MKTATLKDHCRMHALAHCRPYEIIGEKNDLLMLEGTDTWAPAEAFIIETTEECRIIKDSGGGVMLRGKDWTKEQLIDAAEQQPEPLSYLAEQLIGISEGLYMAVGEANNYRLKCEMIVEIAERCLDRGRISLTDGENMARTLKAGNGS